MNFGMWELLIILIIVALLFGTTRIRSMGSDLGNAMKSFRRELQDNSEDEEAPTTREHENRQNSHRDE